jgi:hypothetical protein
MKLGTVVFWGYGDQTAKHRLHAHFISLNMHTIEDSWNEYNA